MKQCIKIIFVSLLIFLSQTSINSQTLPEWFRVYTFNDSFVELNTNYVMLSDRKIERVRFRWIFQTPQVLDKKPRIKYRSILQEVQFDCNNKNFRLYNVQWLSANGKAVASENKKDTGEWREIESGKMMDKLSIQACKLIDLRKREPSVER